MDKCLSYKTPKNDVSFLWDPGEYKATVIGYFLNHNACYMTVIPVALRDNVVAVANMETVTTDAI